MVTKDDWLSVSTLNELMMALDNLVAAWACFWEGDRSMVILRRVVTKTREFSSISNMATRLRLLESFNNKVLEINQRKAIQTEIPLTYKESYDLAKEYMENVTDYVRTDTEDKKPNYSGGNGGNNGGRGAQGVKKTPVERAREYLVKSLVGQKRGGKDYCVEYNLRDHKGDPMCKDRRCKDTHSCGFIARGSSQPCGKSHTKYEHLKTVK